MVELVPAGSERGAMSQRSGRNGTQTLQNLDRLLHRRGDRLNKEYKGSRLMSNKTNSPVRPPAVYIAVLFSASVIQLIVVIWG